MLKLHIDKLALTGQGQGEADGKTVLAWNALPGEDVMVEEFRRKRGRIEGVAREIITPSSDRIGAKEPDHYLSCSPWQIMRWEAENEWKKKLALEAFADEGVSLPDGEIEIVTDGDRQYHYRNKMEYSFTLNDNGDIDLAFFERGRGGLRPIGACHLAHPEINKTANLVLEWLNNMPVSEELAKSLIIRSNLKGETIAGLFVTEYYRFPDMPKLENDFLGFHIYYSRPESPASTPDKLIYSEGQDWLEEEIAGIKLRYGLLSFFQVNAPVFANTLETIADWIPEGKTLVDFFSGVGTISLPLHAKYKKCVLVDENKEACDMARTNIYENDIKNAEVIYERAEKMVEKIKKDRMIIFDPPRPGLHPKIIRRVLEEKPKRIIYLSCNVATQAYDSALLQEFYGIKFIRLYNYFPRTPHLESLVILTRK